MSQGKRCNKIMGSFAIFCQEGPRKVYICCMHNSKYRALFLNSRLNSFCLCHVGGKCTLELGTDTRAREVLVEIKEGNTGKQVFLLYEGNKDQTYTEVGSLQNMAITAIFKNQGESLLRDKRTVPSSIAREIGESTFCAIPYCIFSTITMCTRRCLINPLPHGVLATFYPTAGGLMGPPKKDDISREKTILMMSLRTHRASAVSSSGFHYTNPPPPSCAIERSLCTAQGPHHSLADNFF